MNGNDKVAKMTPSTYEVVKAKATSEGISMAQALDSLLAEAPPMVLTSCVDKAARLSLQRQGVVPPRDLSWAYRVVGVLGELAEASPKLAPFYKAFREAEEGVCPFVAEAEDLVVAGVESEGESAVE
jgi:hypothetical protein